MLNKISPRLIFAGIALLCLTFLAAAWYLQYGPSRQQPCPLCIMQRYLYMGIGIVSLLAAAHGPARTGMVLYSVVADLLASIGAGMAIWQVTKGASMTTCLSDPIGEFINGLPTANYWPEFLFANGSCADQYAPILGVPVPAWSMIWFMIFIVAIGVVLVSTLRSPAAVR